ncbi:response regulator transcription factor [Actinoplanes awajinensis]|uniref:Two-component system response regulator n=1 Tax=Actinoplanes awajinensis subsp. mycoplanecinus TaxID=135947 RepID=A0A101J731_9ACTN|nr:response regulator transcription factor [Actinoplanes awajinensis]KUL21421.1 two-component system response regulator [Actinoplanes awajinensis subsp. mycoplanecinus]
MNRGDVTRILVVEDDPGIRLLLGATLRLAGYVADSVPGGLDALRSVRHREPHLLLVDVLLPDVDGVAVVRTLRDEGRTVPALFLTGLGEPEDRVTAFRAGGDDYVTKPFNVDELLLRIRALLRRSYPGRGEVTAGGQLRFADLILDEQGHRVQRAGQDVWLTSTEFRLLTFLMRHPGQVISKYQIMESVWGPDFDGAVKIVEVYIRYLRQKIDCFDPPLIHTVRGFGYCLRGPAASP